MTRTEDVEMLKKLKTNKPYNVIMRGGAVNKESTIREIHKDDTLIEHMNI